MRLGNRAYRTWGKSELPKYFFKLHQTAPTGPGGLKQVAYGRVRRKIGRKNRKLNDSAIEVPTVTPKYSTIISFLTKNL